MLVAPDGLVVVDTQFADTAAIAPRQPQADEPRGRSTSSSTRTITAITRQAISSSGPPRRNTSRTAMCPRCRKRRPPPRNRRRSRRTPTRPSTRTWSAKVGTETVSLKYYGPGHTSGDSVITFQNANVVHMGDLMFYLRHPRVDRGAGASIKNWIVTLESVAKEHPADTIYIAGHAKVNLPVTVTRADLLKFRDYFSGLLAFVQKGHCVGPPGGRDRESRDRARIRRLRGQSRGHDSGGLRRADREGMRVLGTLLLALSIGAIEAQAQEPRLPAPAADALRERSADSARARPLCRRQLPRERRGLAGHRNARAGDFEPCDPRIDSCLDCCGRHRAGAEGARRAGLRRTR